MISLRAARGLGDAIHLRAVTEHLIKRGDNVTVFTPFRVVFSDLPIIVRPVMEGNECSDLRHFFHRLTHDGVSAFAGACRRIGIEESVDLTIHWGVKNADLVKKVVDLAAGRKIFIFQPRKRPNNPSQVLLCPEKGRYNGVVADYCDHFRIKLGVSAYCFDRSGPCDLDLFNQTSISDALDIATVGDVFFGESCYVPMVGEAMDRQYIIMFTRRALTSEDSVRFLTPSRLFDKKHLATAVYDES